MKKGKVAVFCLVLSLLVAGAFMVSAKAAKQERQDVLYTCDCGPQCNCNSVSIHPGNCKCSMDLKKVD